MRRACNGAAEARANEQRDTARLAADGAARTAKPGQACPHTHGRGRTTDPWRPIQPGPGAFAGPFRGPHSLAPAAQSSRSLMQAIRRLRQGSIVRLPPAAIVSYTHLMSAIAVALVRKFPSSTT